MNKYYIHCAIPYVNAPPHIGHVLDFIYTDVIARYRRLLGDEVLTLSGADENALKNVQAAEKEGVDTQTLVDKNTKLFLELSEKLNTKFDIFQRGSDKEKHYPASQKLWQQCQANDDIYKKSYKGLYCVGCEVFYTPDELNPEGECFEHPGRKLEEVEEENYFFRLSKYQKQIIDLINSGKYQIIPEKRKNEVLSFLKSGLEDISISRSNERAKNWGVPVPGDPSHRMYVWFDALNIYQSGIGFGWNDKQYKKWWPADLQIIGKGILRFHAIYWIAFLLSAGLKLPKVLLVHDYFTVNGQKMSKTVGNVYNPVSLLDKYGTDPLRYYCLAKISPFEDGDFSEDKFFEVYNADLANNLGNLVSRVAKLCETSDLKVEPQDMQNLDQEIAKLLDTYQFNLALQAIWKKIDSLNKQVDENKLWENTTEKQDVLTEIVEGIRWVSTNLQPFLPETAEKIESQFKGPKIKSENPLFPRI